jgi:heme exporter protein A
MAVEPASPARCGEDAMVVNGIDVTSRSDVYDDASGADRGLAGLVSLTRVGVDLDRTPVLREVDLHLGSGETLGVRGPNGSGKSTLLRILATLLLPSAGHGAVLGTPLGGRACWAVRPDICLVAHTPGLYPRLTLAENLRLVARLTGRGDEAAARALDDVGLGGAGHRRAEQCSQGMLRRVELARVLLVQPRLLLLDEPHAGLDAAAFGLVDLVVHLCRQRGGASVMVSHDGVRLAALADRVVEIVDGRLVDCPAGSDTDHGSGYA